MACALKWRRMAGVLLLAQWVCVTAAIAAQEPATPGGPPAFRRLNEAQYVNSINDVFGAGLLIPGRFEPPLRDDGLLAIGESKVVVTPSGAEQYELRAREIAAQVLAEKRRPQVLPCAPPATAGFDAACARQFYLKYGRRVLRRPLDPHELELVLTAARDTTAKSGDFYQGLQAGLSRLLISPYFIFRIESGEPDASAAGQRLDSYSLASRLSFLFWNAPPDDALLDAAASGALRKPRGLSRQIDRLIASPRFEQGVRAFFSDMYGYERFEGLTKEQGIYKKYVSQLAKDAREQSLRTIVDLLVTRHGDYRDLYTTRSTFLNRNLASLYKVPVESAAFDGWMPYTFEPDDQRQGLLTLAGFLMLDPTHEGRSSPTIRGKSVRELLLCQPVPAPPANVDFSILQDTHNPLYRTARDRLTAHRANPVCAGCHAITDPMGLSMENYDAIGQYRLDENSAVIDASGKFNGKSYSNAIELQQALHDEPGLSNCLARRAYEYGVGRAAGAGEREWLAYLSQRFAKDGYRVPELMRTIATSKAFQTVSPLTLASSQR
jgi:Protein of unknown function (DUF1592)/Protein of unknown function (DUF1588)/Protein of unknown function (DUF1585)/Protein of unknown function (DUF1595)/Protein of unknown function (DUF1587)